MNAFYCTVSLEVSTTQSSRLRVDHETAFLTYARLFGALDSVAENHGFTLSGGGQDFDTTAFESAYSGNSKRYEDFKNEVEGVCSALKLERIIRSFSVKKDVGEFSELGTYPLTTSSSMESISSEC